MFLDLSRIEGDRLRERFEIEPTSPLLQGFEPTVRAPLVLDVEARRTSGGTYVVSGTLSGAAEVPCRRCLKPAAIAIEVPLRVVFQEGGRDAERDGDPGDDDIVWIERGAKRLELDEHVRDLLFLETERFPLCDPECRGVCPHCGRELEDGACDCEPASRDTRWKALEGLRFGDED